MITPRADLVALRDSWRARGLRLVLTNGVFDLLHAGHVGYLQQARALGDLLVVALNSDASVRAIKGPLRPLTPEADRAALLAALRCVDYVMVFAEPTAEGVVTALRPEVYVKGGDYALGEGGPPDMERLPEARAVLAYGGEVRLLPYAAGRSTSELIRLIVERYR
ncbi:adenylyltransferase/cytidyltransferase family protein [Chloroflexales bacterium ZM16-3]|nr:adenylyltransferase/cytidyltransferase family protein [Chloroflexales bacterium ZM16-3]